MSNFLYFNDPGNYVDKNDNGSYDEGEEKARASVRFIAEKSGGEVRIKSDTLGKYSTHLISGKYHIYAVKDEEFAHLSTITINTNRVENIKLVDARKLYGKTYEDLDIYIKERH